ncbi:MAG TPA: hypothetical protein VFE62_18390 [Gemmataceae bacterium]|nr:hypothetical protein [Pirellulales bacterium]HZZ80479.1 hypothetical protein [Gemmataceae bacterium]
MNTECRLAKLESQNRMLKVVAFAALVAATLPWAMGSDEAIKEEVRAKRFTLVNDEGSPRGTWAFDQGTKTVSFSMESGATLPSVVLASSPEQSTVRLLSGRNQPVADFPARKGPQPADADISLTAGRDDRATMKVNDGDVIIFHNGKPTFFAPPKTSILPATDN